MSKAWTPFVYDFGFLQLVSSSDLFPKGLLANMFMWIEIFTQMVMEFLWHMSGNPYSFDSSYLLDFFAWTVRFQTSKVPCQANMVG